MLKTSSDLLEWETSDVAAVDPEAEDEIRLNAGGTNVPRAFYRFEANP